ncbi:unnamed protein product, partial [marine sediment metagenome]
VQEKLVENVLEEKVIVQEKLTEKVVEGKKSVPKKQEYSPLLRSLYDVPKSEQYSIILKFLQKLIATTLEYPPGKLPDVEHGFFDLGITSLDAIDLQYKIEKTFSVKLSDTAAFDYPTLKEFTQYLMDIIPRDIEFEEEEPVEKPWKPRK